MKPIRIVHFTSSLKIGGAEAVLYALVSGLHQRQFEQHVIYIHDGPYVERIRALGIPVHHVSGLLLRYDPLFLLRLFILLKKLQPSCLHTLLWAANCSGRFIARLLRIPCVSVYHNNVNQDGFIRSCLDQLTLRCADRIVTVSEEVKTSVTKRIFVPACPLYVIRNGIDYESLTQRALRQAKKRAQLSLLPDDIVIGSVARFHPVKRLDLLITSFAILYAINPKLRLVLLGLGPCEKELRALVHTLGLSHCVTFVVGQEAVGYYPLFDCFVLSSAQEGISMALLEAMGLGVACVVTNVTENHSVITTGHDGIVVPADSSCDALASVLLQVCTDELLRKRLGIHAQQTIQLSFGFSSMIQQYEQVLCK